MVDLFSRPTVASLAGFLAAAEGDNPASARSEAQVERAATGMDRLRRLRQGARSTR
jgi:hypothetical protein